MGGAAPWKPTARCPDVTHAVEGTLGASIIGIVAGPAPKVPTPPDRGGLASAVPLTRWLLSLQSRGRVGTLGAQCCAPKVPIWLSASIMPRVVGTLDASS